MRADSLVLWDVVEEHLEEAGFQWERWERALVSPLLSARQVADGVEGRLAAHLEGLAVAGSAAADRLLVPALHEGEPGEAAAAATAILESPGGISRVRAALADAGGERRRLVTRALALSRRPEERDLFVWFCERCGDKLYETSVRFDDPTDAVKIATDTIRSDIKLRTCRSCGEILAA